MDASRGQPDFAQTMLKLKRDAKTAMEQRRCSALTTCGSVQMLKIKMLGKAVRIFDSFYSLCDMCGACLKLSQIHRFGPNTCCLRCDAVLLKATLPSAPKMEESIKICRYCGSVDPEKSGQPWRKFLAPLDTCLLYTSPSPRD